MPAVVPATIPGGYRHSGVCWRDAELRELTGDDQAALGDAALALLPARWATEVLARSVVRLGPLERVTRETVRSLSVGDREALLLQICRLHSGARLHCVLSCPLQACGEKLDLELPVRDLLVPTYAEPPEQHETLVNGQEGQYLVRFRLPTGADQESASAHAAVDLEAAAELLLGRLVQSVTTKDGVPVPEIPACVREQLPAVMAALDPQAEVSLDVYCAACGHSFPAIFDAAHYLLKDTRARSLRLYREVHTLAFHYHWSAAEILGMTPTDRRRYLELLDEELSRGSER